MLEFYVWVLPQSKIILKLMTGGHDDVVIARASDLVDQNFSLL